jgi:starch synthase
VEDEVTGILVPPGDPDALASAILTLLKDPARARKMGKAGRERVLANFTADDVVRQMLRVYESVCKRSTAA